MVKNLTSNYAASFIKLFRILFLTIIIGSLFTQVVFLFVEFVKDDFKLIESNRISFYFFYAIITFFASMFRSFTTLVSLLVANLVLNLAKINLLLSNIILMLVQLIGGLYTFSLLMPEAGNYDTYYQTACISFAFTGVIIWLREIIKEYKKHKLKAAKLNTPTSASNFNGRHH